MPPSHSVSALRDPAGNFQLTILAVLEIPRRWTIQSLRLLPQSPESAETKERFLAVLPTSMPQPLAGIASVNGESEGFQQMRPV